MYTTDNETFFNILKNLLQEQIFNTTDNRFPCVVFDIDGTLINNELNQVIKPVYEFFHYCKEIGIKIIILTARPNYPKNIIYTKQMLSNLNIETQHFYFMDRENYIENKQRRYKEKIRQDILKNNEITLSIGDMPFDMDNYCNVGVLVKYINDNLIDYFIEKH